MLKVLFVASEVVPFAKTGGLADVAGSLPKELRAQGIDVRVVMPKYGNIAEKYKKKMKPLLNTQISVAWREKFCGVEYVEHDTVPVYFIDNEEYFKREGFYGYDDDAERFSFFSRAVLNMLPKLDFKPDIIHINDWHASLVSVFLKLEHQNDPYYTNIRTVYTIHNLKYQGVFPKTVMNDVLGLDMKYFQNGDLEFFDAVNFMKGGIIYSDYITTVSRTYAQEIQYEYFGEKLDGLLCERSKKLVGIINGLDYDLYNPKTDRHLVVNYDENSASAKLDNKVALQQELGLPVHRKVPVLAIVSRLVGTKGLDLIIRIMDEILQHEDVQVVILGTGDKKYEDWFKGLAWRFPKKVSANITFSNSLAHKIYAAADMFIMPSRYEPCGIGQLIALRYGSIPIVRETGGLKDTVQAFDKYTQTGNGFVFTNYNAHELLFAIKQALGTYSDQSIWNTIVQNAMTSDYSWKKSAQQYKELYTSLKK
jgi:starch synthase